MNANHIHAAITTYAPAIIPAITRCPPQHSGILPSEMLAFIAVCFDHSVRTVVESGRKMGVSTEILSNIDWHVISIDTDPIPEADARLAGRPNLELLKGDGKRFVTAHRPAPPAALLCDGPKGNAAYQLVQSVRGRYAVCAIHDAHPGSVLRQLIGDEWYLTDDPWLIENYGYLDFDHLAHIGHTSHNELLSAANCLAIL